MPEGKAVEQMFSGISGKYDSANHILSGGIDWYWRYRLVRAVQRHRPTAVADLATGSGDVAFALRKKQERRTIVGELSFSFGDCLNLPLENAAVDAVTIAFGLRNLEDRHRGLQEMRRILDPERGALFVLEFTQPHPALKPFYRIYLKGLLPTLAKWTTGNRSAYDYLVGSINSFPEKETLSGEFRKAGFREVNAIGLTGSIVALHVARV